MAFKKNKLVMGTELVVLLLLLLLSSFLWPLGQQQQCEKHTSGRCIISESPSSSLKIKNILRQICTAGERRKEMGAFCYISFSVGVSTCTYGSSGQRAVSRTFPSAPIYTSSWTYRGNRVHFVRELERRGLVDGIFLYTTKTLPVILFLS